MAKKAPMPQEISRKPNRRLAAAPPLRKVVSCACIMMKAISIARREECRRRCEIRW